MCILLLLEIIDEFMLLLGKVMLNSVCFLIFDVEGIIKFICI